MRPHAATCKASKRRDDDARVDERGTNRSQRGDRDVVRLAAAPERHTRIDLDVDESGSLEQRRQAATDVRVGAALGDRLAERPDDDVGRVLRGRIIGRQEHLGRVDVLDDQPAARSKCCGHPPHGLGGLCAEVGEHVPRVDEIEGAPREVVGEDVGLHHVEPARSAADVPEEPGIRVDGEDPAAWSDP
jgi:hypothetical protein